MFFHRDELTVRCAYRGLALTVPDRDRLLNSCDQGQRRRLQRFLGKPSPREPAWLVEWRKAAGDLLQPQDVVATLRRDGIVVELTYAQRGVLTETLVSQGEHADAGRRLALLERRAKTASVPAPAPQNTDLLRQFVARQRRDAELIAELREEVAAHLDLIARLRSELAVFRDLRVPRAIPVADAKFRRMKLEFGKRFHPDARPPGDAERELRGRVFQEFWSIIEEIERS